MAYSSSLSFFLFSLSLSLSLSLSSKKNKIDRYKRLIYFIFYSYHKMINWQYISKNFIINSAKNLHALASDKLLKIGNFSLGQCDFFHIQDV